LENNTNNEETNNKTSRKVLWIAISIAIIIIIVICILLIRSHNANSQIKELRTNIENNKVSNLAKQLSNNEQKMSESQASQLIKYLTDNKNHKRFNTEISKVIKNTKNNNSNSTKLGEITNNKGEPIITFKKNGKQYFILDKIAMEVNYKPVYIKEGQFSSEYKVSNAKNKISEPYKLTYIGDFVDGEYQIPTSKIIDNGPIKDELNGYLKLNTNNRNKDGKIIAAQQFKQAQFKVVLHNDEKIDKNSKKITINDHEYEFENNKVYGYIPATQDFKVFAKGNMGKHTFETKPGNVFYHSNNQIQVVHLYFDLKDINKKIADDKKKAKEQKKKDKKKSKKKK
jgi:uncharacterized membrane protein YvbJ